MNIFIATELQNEAQKSVEKEIGRELSVEELKIFYKTSRICLMKGFSYAKRTL